jgi:YggT family protein
MISLFCYVLSTVISIYVWIIIIAALMSFFQPNHHNPAVQFIYRVTDPVFKLAREYLPFLVISGIDLSPIVIILALQYIPRVICQLLF